MITCRNIGGGLCINCLRNTKHTMQYKFENRNIIKYLYLCEDCSNAIANLHYKVITENKDYKYDKDEIEEVENER